MSETFCDLYVSCTSLTAKYFIQKYLLFFCYVYPAELLARTGKLIVCLNDRSPLNALLSSIEMHLKGSCLYKIILFGM